MIYTVIFNPPRVSSETLEANSHEKKNSLEEATIRSRRKQGSPRVTRLRVTSNYVFRMALTLHLITLPMGRSFRNILPLRLTEAKLGQHAESSSRRIMSIRKSSLGADR